VGAVAFCDWDLAKRHLPDEGEELFVSCPIAIDPSHFSRRIAAQRSRFTIFGKEPDRLKNLVNGKIASFTLSAKLSLKSSATLMVWHEPALPHDNDRGRIDARRRIRRRLSERCRNR
jgi:hypothetical protein